MTLVGSSGRLTWSLVWRCLVLCWRLTLIWVTMLVVTLDLMGCVRIESSFRKKTLEFPALVGGVDWVMGDAMEDADVAWAVGNHFLHPSIDEALPIGVDSRDDGALVFISSAGGGAS